MMAFAIRALSHPSLQVREVAEQILLSLYRLLGTPVRQCLVPESTKTSRNFTYKKVFEEFEKIDKEYSFCIPQERPPAVHFVLFEKVGKRRTRASLFPTVRTRSEGVGPLDVSRTQPGSAQRPPRRQRSASADSPSSGSGRRDFVKEVAAPSSRSLQELSKVPRQEQATINLDKTNWPFEHCNFIFVCVLQVVEISGLTRHLLEECASRSQYRLCIRCKEAIAKTRFEGHVKLKTCVLAKPPHQANHCPLCHQNFAPGDDAWKVHLMSEVGCPFNPRRRNKFFRWRSVGLRSECSTSVRGFVEWTAYASICRREKSATLTLALSLSLSGSVWEPEYSVAVPDSMAGKLKILGALPPEYRQYTVHHTRSKSEPAKRSSGTQTNDEDDEAKAQ
ncbi:hypothetical protein HPB48_002790 [Haemaphysalis longicornis]|uniref:Centrosomal protein CEP104 Zn finger domain-containing protein n=1 Tax=Haemaphysalis longicornis TaxID=44386 RepID=A0A9J6GQL3_HAELO|nr:hypothetical protein HPB48_002790 [Haemaphysalis longicornis]